MAIVPSSSVMRCTLAQSEGIVRARRMTSIRRGAETNLSRSSQPHASTSPALRRGPDWPQTGTAEMSILSQ